MNAKQIEAREQYDDYISLAQASKILPGRPHVSTLYRWEKGLADGRRLRCRKIGGRMFTRLAWISDFFGDEVTAAPSAASTRRAEQAERELEEAGV